MSLMEILHPILPRNEVSILAGASGAGKTTLIMQMIAAVQKNTPFFGFSPGSHPWKLGYIVADRAKDSALHWATRGGVDTSQLGMRSLVDDSSISLAKLSTSPMDLLFELAESLLPLDLLVVDPMIVFLGGDTKQYNQNAAKLILLNRWAKKHDVTILGTHHAAKARTDYGFKRPQDRISGTSALLGYTSTQLFLNTPEEASTDYYSFHVVAHTHEGLEIKLQRDTTNGMFIPYTGEKDVDAQIMEMLETAEAAGRSEFLKTLAIPERTVDYHLDGLVKAGRIVKPSHGRYTKAN